MMGVVSRYLCVKWNHKAFLYSAELHIYSVCPLWGYKTSLALVCHSIFSSQQYSKYTSRSI